MANTRLPVDPALAAFQERHIMCSQGPHPTLPGTWMVYKHASDCKHTAEDNWTLKSPVDTKACEVAEELASKEFLTHAEAHAELGEPCPSDDPPSDPVTTLSVVRHERYKRQRTETAFSAATSTDREIHIRDTMRVPLRKIVDFVRSLEGSFEEDGIAELKLHSLMSEYIEARATFAGVRWRRGIDQPLQAEWCAALLERTGGAGRPTDQVDPMVVATDRERARRWMAGECLGDDPIDGGASPRIDGCKACEDALTKLIGEVRAEWTGEWADKPTPEDEAIKAVFPTRSERHDLYGEAMRLVGARHGKFALVALVNWLLHRIEAGAGRESAKPQFQPLCGVPTGSKGRVCGYPLPCNRHPELRRDAFPSQAPAGTACDRCGATNTSLKNEATFLFCYDRKGCDERRKGLHKPTISEALIQAAIRMRGEIETLYVARPTDEAAWVPLLDAIEVFNKTLPDHTVDASEQCRESTQAPMFTKEEQLRQMTGERDALRALIQTDRKRIIDEIVDWLHGLERARESVAVGGSDPREVAVMQARRGVYEGVADDIKRKWGS